MTQINGAAVSKALLLVAKRVEEAKDYLCELDGEVGDGDHGVSMTIGMRAVTRAVKDLPTGVTPSQAFQTAADAYADEVGATIGPLYEAAFAAAAKAAGSKSTINEIGDWASIFEAMAIAIQVLGKAERGDKTILDSFFPAVDYIKSISSSGKDLATALSETAEKAMEAAIATKTLVASKGRASRLGERAMGHQDAGATSLAIVLAGFSEAIAKE
jgi:dihydroxyacetone kinase-like protein